ncbi:GTP-binding protein Rhes [Hoplias malabaricus]|uniref:GTP-binding protein Rhes n=1 Tax=Hoplias malabaricus TaxID=27720 RepID=UPI0034627AAF
MDSSVPVCSPRLLLSYKRAAQRLISKAGARVLNKLHHEHDHERPACSLRTCRRVVVLGAPRAGKTSLVRRFLREDFEERYEPTREEFRRKVYRIRGEEFQIDLLDPAAERQFPAKRRLTILTGDIFLLVLSVDDRGSFEEACALRSEIQAAKAALLRSPSEGSRVPVVVCANKADLPAEERQVSHAELMGAFGSSKDPACVLFEASAKEGGPSLERVFEALAVHAGLPVETGPSLHHKLSMRSYRTLRGKAKVQETPCGALHPLARRPSVSADLRLVLATHGKKGTSKTTKK